MSSERDPQLERMPAARVADQNSSCGRGAANASVGGPGACDSRRELLATTQTSEGLRARESLRAVWVRLRHRCRSFMHELLVQRASLARARPWQGARGALLVGLFALATAGLFVGQLGRSSPQVTAVPAALADIAFRDQHGARFDLRSVAGRPLLLNFIFTRCGSVCPLQTRELVELQRRMPEGRARALLVSVSIDPEHDAPAELLAFSQKYQASWPFLVASAAQTSALSQRLGAAAPPTAETTSNVADHGTGLYLFDRSGRLVQRYGGAPIDRERVLRDLLRLQNVEPRQ